MLADQPLDYLPSHAVVEFVAVFVAAQDLVATRFPQRDVIGATRLGWWRAFEALVPIARAFLRSALASILFAAGINDNVIAVITPVERHGRSSVLSPLAGHCRRFNPRKYFSGAYTVPICKTEPQFETRLSP
jgi:hypothetical protein